MKLLVSEPGSEIASEFWALPNPAASSVLALAEGRAALAVAHRAGRLTARQYGEVVSEFGGLRRELHLIDVNSDLARHGGELAEEQGLRGYDAVHLASALSLGRGTTLVGWDRELAQAAQRCGLHVAPPIDPLD